MVWVFHIGIIALIALCCVKYQFWVPMLITFVLSLIYFNILLNANDGPEKLWPVVFFIWPPFYTLSSLFFWWIFREIGISVNLKK